MRRTAIFVALALAIVFAGALININRAANDDHAAHQDQQHQQHTRQPQSQEQQKLPKIDGSATPDAIPDYAAQEVVLRILSSDEPDKIGDRKKAYLRAHGFDEDAQAALMLAARDYKRLVAGVEKDTDDIKNQTWPTPDRKTMDRLAGLQREKETLIASVSADLTGRLRNFNALAKWEDHITKKVKPKMKGFRIDLPQKKTSFFRLLPDPFAAHAQASGCDTDLFIYSDTVIDWDLFLVYGFTSSSAPSNNCGHTFTPRTTTSGSLSATGDGFVVINLDQGDYFIDDGFSTFSEVDVFCSIAFVTYLGGTAYSNATVAPFISVGPFGAWSPAGDAKLNITKFATVTIRGSSGAGGRSFNVEVGADTIAGEFDIEITTAASSLTVPTTLNKTMFVSLFAKPTVIHTSPARFRGRMEVDSAALTVRGSPRTTGITNIVP